MDGAVPAGQRVDKQVGGGFLTLWFTSCLPKAQNRDHNVYLWLFNDGVIVRSLLGSEGKAEITVIVTF